MGAEGNGTIPEQMVGMGGGCATSVGIACAASNLQKGRGN
jgi:hypothetical protein